MIMIVFVVALVLAVWYLFRHRPIVNTSETIIGFTGGPGSGKTANSVHYSVKLYKKNCLHCWLHKLPQPILLSNIPIRYRFFPWSKWRYSCLIDNDITLLKKRIPRYSIVFIDEIGSYASQFDYKAKNMERFDEFVRFFRHYVRGTFICADQCSENIVLQVRRRINVVNNLQGFHKWLFLPICSYNCRPITISEEIKSIVQVNEDDPNGYKKCVFLGNPFKFYDSYCYSVRYDEIEEYNKYHKFCSLKTSELFTLDKS